MKRHQKEFDFIKGYSVVRKPRDVVCPNVGCRLRTDGAMFFGYGADCGGGRHFAFTGHLRPSPNLTLSEHRRSAEIA
jgi:hypothetical protein